MFAYHINKSNIRRSSLPSKAIIRFPLPYKVGEDFRPGNVDEKLRSEAATYLWLQEHCPDVPVPDLLGFGFPGGQSVSRLYPRRIMRHAVPNT